MKQVSGKILSQFNCLNLTRTLTSVVLVFGLFATFMRFPLLMSIARCFYLLGSYCNTIDNFMNVICRVIFR